MKELKWEEAKKVLKTGITFLQFTTEWCGDCKMMVPVVEKVENELKEIDMKFIKVDAEEANLFRDANSKIQVLKVPAFYKVVNGKYSLIGYEYLPIEELKAPFE